MGIILGVTGGRVATVTQFFIDGTLDLIHEREPVDILVHGNAKGVDRMCGMWAKKHGIHVAIVDALWDEYSTRAGPLRNKAMLRLKPDLVVAFPGMAGTADMRRQTLEQKIRLIKAG